MNYKVVREFIAKVKERAVGHDVLSSLTPGQQVIRIVNEELTGLMGGSRAQLTLASKAPSVVMVVGLQGGPEKQPQRPNWRAC